MKYWLITATDSEPYMFKKTYSEIVVSDNPKEAEVLFNKFHHDRTITDVKEIDMNNRSIAQAYTHKVTLKQDILGEKKGTEYVLFDDGKVYDSEIMAFRVPPKSVCMVVANWSDFPMLCSAVVNPKYHVHKYEDKVVSACECGDIKE